MKAESILKRREIDILLIPAPRALSTDCGLAIRFNSNLYESVLKALMDENISPTIIYRKKNDSEYEPIWNTENRHETDR